jgi:hypothetical protein
MSLSGLLHLLQGEGGDLRGRIGLAVRLDPGVAVRGPGDLVGDELLVLLDHRVVVAAPDQALHCEEGFLRIGDSLALGRLADEALAIVGKGDDRRGRPHTFGILNNFRRFAIHDGNARIRGAEIDTDDLSHVLLTLSLRRASRALSGTRRRSFDGLCPPTPVRPPNTSKRSKVLERCRRYKRGTRPRKRFAHESATSLS